MAPYLYQATYTPQAIAHMINSPQSREEPVHAAVEKMGGKVHGFWFSFGEYDTVEIIELPDNADAVAFSMTVSAAGALKAIKTTPLLTMDEAVLAMQRAGGTIYRPSTDE